MSILKKDLNNNINNDNNKYPPKGRGRKQRYFPIFFLKTIKRTKNECAKYTKKSLIKNVLDNSGGNALSRRYLGNLSLFLSLFSFYRL